MGLAIDETKGAAKAGAATDTATRGYGFTVERVVKELRRMIFTGEFPPGAHVRQDELARRLGVTRVPVREAFKTLVAEGILVHEPNRGHFVASFGVEALGQLSWLGGVLESELIRTMRWPDEATIAAVRRINDELLDAARRGDPEEVIVKNREFHFRLFELSPQKLLVRELARVWDLIEGYLGLYFFRSGVTERVLHEHGDIVDAVERHDRRAYDRIMADHRRWVQEIVSDFIERNGALTEAP